MQEYVVRVTRYGYATVECDSEEEALLEAKSMVPGELDWGEMEDHQIVEP